jgi:hypothetical protein
VISTIVNSLLDINKKYVLLAPTGRAAKFEQTGFYDSKNLLSKRNLVAFRLRYNKTKHKNYIYSR